MYGGLFIFKYIIKMKFKFRIILFFDILEFIINDFKGLDRRIIMFVCFKLKLDKEYKILE